MHLKRASGVALIIILMSGCRTQPAPPAPHSADDMTLTRVRESFKRIDPHSEVGIVIAAVPAEQLVAVGEVPVNSFTPGETIMFIDSDQNPLTSGTVLRNTGDALHVHYDTPDAGRRAPVIGDLAVKVR